MDKNTFLADFDATAATVKENCHRGPYPGGKSEDFIRGQTRGIGQGLKIARHIIESIFDDPKRAPGHTDLMVTPESLDKFMAENPLPELKS